MTARIRFLRQVVSFLACRATFRSDAGAFRVDRGSLRAGRRSIVLDTCVLPVDTWPGGVCMNQPTQSAADGWFACRRFRALRAHSLVASGFGGDAIPKGPRWFSWRCRRGFWCGTFLAQWHGRSALPCRSQSHQSNDAADGDRCVRHSHHGRVICRRRHAGRSRWPSGRSISRWPTRPPTRVM